MVDSKRTSIARRASPGATTTISFIVSLAVSNVGYACQFLDKKGLEDGESSLTIAYLSLAERFNSGLQGRFPFADELEGYEASVDGIREVRKALDQLQISNDIQELPVRVQDFLRALDRSLAFLHALPQQYEDRKGVTLRFQVPVGAEESTHMGDRLAEVFIQMTLVGDDGKEISPPVFPVQAPCF
jgi:hypothetical protein